MAVTPSGRKLTPRQTEVLALREQGLSIKQIAAALVPPVKPGTVRIFVKQLMSAGALERKAIKKKWNPLLLDETIMRMEASVKEYLAHPDLRPTGEVLGFWMHEIKEARRGRE